METTLNVVQPETVGGHTIDVEPLKVRNPRTHRAIEHYAKAMIFNLECDSQNMSNYVKPSDVRTIRAQVTLGRESFAFQTAEENNDLPTGSYEFAYEVLVPIAKELQRMRSTKLREANVEIYDLIQILATLDSGNSQGFIAPDDVAKSETRMDFLDRTLDRLLGNGANLGDTGIKYPDMGILGTLNPALNNHYAVRLEPSKKGPIAPLPDTPDTRSE
jgi:hypothetical protein